MTVAPVSGGHLTFSCTNDQSVEMAGDKVMLLYMCTATHGKHLVTSARVLDLSNLLRNVFASSVRHRSALKNRRDPNNNNSWARKVLKKALCLHDCFVSEEKVSRRQLPSASSRACKMVQARSVMCYMLCGTRLFQQSMRNTLANVLIFMQDKTTQS